MLLVKKIAVSLFIISFSVFTIMAKDIVDIVYLFVVILVCLRIISIS